MALAVVAVGHAALVISSVVTLHNRQRMMISAAIETANRNGEIRGKAEGVQAAEQRWKAS